MSIQCPVSERSKFRGKTRADIESENALASMGRFRLQ